MRRLLFSALSLSIVLHAPAGAQGVMAAVRADDWARAEALVAGDADPLALKLVRFYRLLTPGAARAGEIAAFMAGNPGWPFAATLERRLGEALGAERDGSSVLAMCRVRVPDTVPGQLRCAEAFEAAGDPPLPARQAWIGGITDPAQELAFLKRWSAVLTPEDGWRRFERLGWTDAGAPGGALARQAVRLAPQFRALAEARLALRRDMAGAPKLVEALPEAARRDPGTVLELARWYRRAGRDGEAAGVWAAGGEAAAAAAPAERWGLFWDERNLLARRLLRAGDAEAAYRVAALRAPGGEGVLDGAFLAGWLALRRLGRVEEARGHFQRLAEASGAAISQARAQYWLGRTAQAAGEDGAAAFRAASRWGTTFYGQLATRALGEAPALADEPGWDAARAAAFLGREEARAAVLLAAWGDTRRARPFLQRLADIGADAGERAMAARLALGLGLPDAAVGIARRAGRDGTMLPVSGWPEIAVPGEGGVEAAAVLGLARQESSFDVAAQSPVGARGLMQLMPATAAQVARKLGLPNDPAALLADGAYNMRLGTAFLAGLLERFGSLPLALAGYNAGPGRVADWLALNPAPGDAEAAIDWIEQIPFTETRNYVQRVIENVVIYRLRLGTGGPDPLLPVRPGDVRKS